MKLQRVNSSGQWMIGLRYIRLEATDGTRWLSRSLFPFVGF